MQQDTISQTIGNSYSRKGYFLRLREDCLLFPGVLCYDNKNEMAGIVTAHLAYVVPPTEEQKKGMEQFVCREFHAKGVLWEMEERPSLIGGFLLLVNGREYDYSMQGRLKRLEQKLTWR